VRRLVAYLWAGPVSLAALPLAAAALATGGRARIEDGVLEVAGGVLARLLSRAIPSFPIGAITLGHVVLGTDARQLDACRAHERVHVRQYERWGSFFPLLYLASSASALLTGRRFHADNRFEREASQADGIRAA
jgi:hypothetical protein